MHTFKFYFSQKQKTALYAGYGIAFTNKYTQKQRWYKGKIR